MNTPDHCDFSARDFSATAIETSDGRLIRVSGVGLCPSAGWDLRLAAANPGVVPHPESLWLELRERAPRRTPQVITRTTVEVIIEDSRAEQIVIRFGWREGFVVPVRPAAARQVGGGRPRRQRADATGDPVAASDTVAATDTIAASVG